MAKEKNRARGEFGEAYDVELAPKATCVPFDYRSQDYTDDYYDRRKREERLYNMMRERMKYD